MNLFTLIKSDNYVLFALIDISQLHNQQSTFVFIHFIAFNATTFVWLTL